MVCGMQAISVVTRVQAPRTPLPSSRPRHGDRAVNAAIPVEGARAIPPAAPGARHAREGAREVHHPAAALIEPWQLQWVVAGVPGRLVRHHLVALRPRPRDGGRLAVVDLAEARGAVGLAVVSAVGDQHVFPTEGVP
eukprot:167299-Prymnesium_polylepis.1